MPRQRQSDSNLEITDRENFDASRSLLIAHRRATTIGNIPRGSVHYSAIPELSASEKCIASSLRM